MNSHGATRTTAIGPPQHPLIVTLMLGILMSATNTLGQKMEFYPIRSAPLGSPVGTIGAPVNANFNVSLGCWEYRVPAGGIEVDLDLQASGWGKALCAQPTGLCRLDPGDDCTIPVDCAPCDEDLDCLHRLGGDGTCTDNGATCSGGGGACINDVDCPMGEACVGRLAPCTLGAIQATVISAGYNNGVGAPLNPKGWPDRPRDGAYQATNACGPNGDGFPCTSPFDPTCGGVTFCPPNANWVMPGCTLDLQAIATQTLDYAWASAAQTDCNIDDGLVKTMGGLILEVPANASGTYVIALDPDPDFTFMYSGRSVLIPVEHTPACITIVELDRNRYLTFEPDESGEVAYHLEMVSSLFHPSAIVEGWVGVPDANGIASLESDPVTREWTELVVNVTGCQITPVAEFELRASSDDGLTFLPPTSLHTTPQPGGNKFWGDLVGAFDGNYWSPAQGVVNVDDFLAVIKTWQQVDRAPELPRTDIEPQEPNRVVNFNDVLLATFAFEGDPYPFGCSDDPCQDNIANPCP